MTTWTRNLYEHDYLAIAKGESNDYAPRNIFGYNALVGTSYIPCWENNTAYTQPTTGLTMTVTPRQIRQRLATGHAVCGKQEHR